MAETEDEVVRRMVERMIYHGTDYVVGYVRELRAENATLRRERDGWQVTAERAEATIKEMAAFGELNTYKNPDALELRFLVSRVALTHGGPSVMALALQRCSAQFRDYWRRTMQTAGERLAHDLATGLADMERAKRRSVLPPAEERQLANDALQQLLQTRQSDA